MMYTPETLHISISKGRNKSIGRSALGFFQQAAVAFVKKYAIMFLEHSRAASKETRRLGCLACLGGAVIKKPSVIALLSIVPGLGLLVLGEVAKGLGVMALMTLLVLPFLLTSSETILTWLFVLVLIVWVAQIYYAVVLAQRRARAEAGTALPERSVWIAPPPPGASAGERSMHKARVAVMQVLPAGERLRLALHVTTGGASLGEGLLDLALAATGTAAGPRDIRQVYLGVTESDLVLVNLDAFGKPLDLRRVPLERVSVASSKEGLLSDEVTINVGGATPLKVAAGRQVRQGTRQLLAILSGSGIDHPEPAAPLPPEPSPVSAAAARPSKHPLLFSALLGAAGGIAGVPAAVLLSALLAVLVGEPMTGDPGLAEGLGILLGLYCLVMFPIGGLILGAISGTTVGALRGGPEGRLAPLPPLLAGFATVVILTLGALLVLLVTLR